MTADDIFPIDRVSHVTWGDDTRTPAVVRERLTEARAALVRATRAANDAADALEGAARAAEDSDASELGRALRDDAREASALAKQTYRRAVLATRAAE